jgi:hypothetical protein
MGKKTSPSDVIRERLEELFRLGASLQDYVFSLRRDAPHDPAVTEVVLELHKLETRLSVINEMLYQDKMSLTIERAIERLRSNKTRISAKNLTEI